MLNTNTMRRTVERAEKECAAIEEHNRRLTRKETAAAKTHLAKNLAPLYDLHQNGSLYVVLSDKMTVYLMDSDQYGWWSYGDELTYLIERFEFCYQTFTVTFYITLDKLEMRVYTDMIDFVNHVTDEASA